jgi:aryl-alcohol dehydrogenase-like predicted oxidoreductase
MNRRTLGRDAQRFGEVGLGTWQLGAEWGDVSDETAARVLDRAFDAGVTFFDTADIYGGGKSERRIAAFLKRLGPRAKDVFVATKLGRSSDPGWPANFSLASFRKFTEGSLARLGVERLDLTQTHCLPHDRMKSGDMWDWLRTLQREGKIGRFGASVESMEEAETCLNVEGLASLQIIFNVLRQRPLENVLAKAKEKGVGIVARLPMASGLLSGRFTATTQFAVNDHRHFNRDGQSFNVGETFAGLPLAKGVEIVERLKGFVPASMTLSQFAMRWLLDHDAVSVVIPGATKPEQIAENCTASALPTLPTETHAALRNFFRADVEPHLRGPQ